MSISDSNRRRGQVLIMVALVLTPLFAALGFVTDFGYMHYVKMSAQSAAEAGAQAAIVDFRSTAGGTSFTCGGDVVCASTPTSCPSGVSSPTNSIQHGCMYAQAHGFNSLDSKGNPTGADVSYQTGVSSVPPTVSGMGAAAYWVTFRVTQSVPQLFSAILGNMTGTVAARSTAVITGARDCIYALDPNASGAVSITGTAGLTSSCGIMVNSKDACAISTNGNATLSAAEYDVVGNTCTAAPLTPAPNTGVAPASDPLSSLQAPASAPYHCDYKNFSAPNNGSTITLSPGVYCGGIQVKNNTYSFGPGVYILVGGGLSTQDSNSHIVGSGVTFYNTFGSTDNMGGQTYSYGSIGINANSTVNLTAPTDLGDTYDGVLFFDDRAAPSGNADTYGGGATAVYQGAIYAKTNGIKLYGNSSATGYTLVVADTITLVGTATFNNDYSSLPGGVSPLQVTAVIE